jgi:cell division ATPase FtsA
MLNLAMVDIGAGTSDIAISRNGSISAYAMVSMAGDEVTDEIAQHFLLDFQSAEGVKRKLFSEASSTVCRDVMGNQTYNKPGGTVRNSPAGGGKDFPYV